MDMDGSGSPFPHLTCPALALQEATPAKVYQQPGGENGDDEASQEAFDNEAEGADLTENSEFTDPANLENTNIPTPLA